MENEAIAYKTLAEDAFLSLGAQQIAYVRPIDLPDGVHAFGIFSADGSGTFDRNRAGTDPTA
jgi:hypothetical protein